MKIQVSGRIGTIDDYAAIDGRIWLSVFEIGDEPGNDWEPRFDLWAAALKSSVRGIREEGTPEVNAAMKATMMGEEV